MMSRAKADGSRSRRLRSIVRCAAFPVGIGVFPIATSAQVTFMTQWGSPGSSTSELLNPEGVAVGPTGTVYVADTNNNRIEVFNASGSYQSSFGVGIMSDPSGVAVSPTGNVYATDAGNERIVEFSSSGFFQSQFGSGLGSGIQQFNEPAGMAVGPTGSVFVADTGNNRIEVLNSSLSMYQRTIDTAVSGGTTPLASPKGVAVDPTGIVYVADTGNNEIQVFNTNNIYASTIGTGEGSGNTQFNGPEGMAADSAGAVYVADTGNNRIQIFNSVGAYQATITNSFNQPGDVAVAPSGFFYVADTGSDRIQEFFNPSSWVSGTDTFNGTASPSSVSLGVSGGTLSITSAMGLVVSGTTTVNSNSTVIQFGGSISSSSLVVNGSFESQSGALAVGVLSVHTGGSFAGGSVSLSELDQSGGSISATSINLSNSSISTVAGGNLTTNALVVGLDGLLQSSGTCSIGVATLGIGSELAMAGGSMSATSILVEGGTVNNQGGVHNIGTLTFVGGTLTGGSYTVNTGETLSLGALAVTNVTCSILTVTAGGTVSDDANFSSAVVNIAGTFNYLAGKMPATTDVEAGGLLSVSLGLTNNNVLNVQTGGLVAGSSSINNGATGQIIGAGTVACGVSNGGLIEPIGGLLNFTSSLTNNGTITVGDLSEALFSNFPANGGTINLSGGAVNTSGQPMANNAIIEGSGMLITGGLTNNATLALAGSSSVSGPVINAASGTIHVSGSSPNTFLGAMTNSGALIIDAGASGTVYGAYTGAGKIVDNGSLFLNANSVAGPISGNGNLTVGSTSSGPAVVALNVSSGLSTLSSLNVVANSTLDITNNHLIIDYATQADPIGSIAALIKSGYAGGAWNGPGIDSSAAAASPGYGLGYADSADPGNPAGLSSGQIEIQYTMLGDADLNGVVNDADFRILAANFNKSVSRWDQGDFNYDNVVNAGDFAALVANFNKETDGASVGPGPLSDPAIVAFAEANGLMADVPEANSLAMAAGLGLGLLARRRGARSLRRRSG